MGISFKNPNLLYKEFIYDYFVNSRNVIYMKFIIPQNYDFSSKLFGFIDYSTVIFNVIWCALVFSISSLIISSLYIKIFAIIIFCFLVLLFSIVLFNHVNILYVLFYMYKFFFRQKVYLYM